jgi:branched-chain amino acid transport system substrate-binding protein
LKLGIAIGVAVAVVAVAAGVRAATGSSAPKHALTHGTVTFGILAPLSQQRGRDLAAGAELAAAEISARGGVLGRRVVVASADDRCATDPATAGARRLVHAHVAGIVGGVCSDAVRPALDVLDAARTPLLITAADADDLVGDPYGFLLTGTFSQAALAAEHWIVDRDPGHVAVVSDATTGSRDLARLVAGHVRVDVPAHTVRTRPGEPSPQLAASVLRSHPDFVYWTGTAGGGQLVQALRAAGYRGTFLAASADPQLLAQQGAFAITAATPQLLPKARSWSARYQARFERPPTREAMQGYDGLRALAEAVREARTPRAAAVASRLAGLGSFSTFLGPLAFSADHSLTYDDHVIARVRNGALTLQDTLRSTD